MNSNVFNLAITLSIGFIAAILKIRLIQTNIINQEPSAKKTAQPEELDHIIIEDETETNMFTEIETLLENYDDDYDC